MTFYKLSENALENALRPLLFRDNLKDSLPSIEEIEAELKGDI